MEICKALPESKEYHLYGKIYEDRKSFSIRYDMLRTVTLTISKSLIRQRLDLDEKTVFELNDGRKVITYYRPQKKMSLKKISDLCFDEETTEIDGVNIVNLHRIILDYDEEEALNSQYILSPASLITCNSPITIAYIVKNNKVYIGYWDIYQSQFCFEPVLYKCLDI